jgi:hypothetical protein
VDQLLLHIHMERTLHLQLPNHQHLVVVPQKLLLEVQVEAVGLFQQGLSRPLDAEALQLQNTLMARTLH